jgi:type I pantothenate kinase
MSLHSMSCFHPIDKHKSSDPRLSPAALKIIEKKFNSSGIHISWNHIKNHYLSLAQYLNHALVPQSKRPVILGICGSISAGKTTTARILQKLLENLGRFESVEICSTDGFLHSLSTLTERQILHRKGFPESYNTEHFHSFLTALHRHEAKIEVPIYSHEKYDTLNLTKQLSGRANLIIVEGLNLLNPPKTRAFFDQIIYLDAPTPVIKQWYLERFMLAYNTSFQDPTNYFYELSNLSPDAALDKANTFWEAINGVNLQEHIIPVKHHAHIIVEKTEAHGVASIKIRQ